MPAKIRGPKPVEVCFHTLNEFSGCRQLERDSNLMPPEAHYEAECFELTLTQRRSVAEYCTTCGGNLSPTRKQCQHGCMFPVNTLHIMFVWLIPDWKYSMHDPLYACTLYCWKFIFLKVLIHFHMVCLKRANISSLTRVSGARIRERSCFTST
jgi:hypothetical protein